MQYKLLAGTDPNCSLLDYQNTLSKGIGSFFAQQRFGQRTRTLLPTSLRLLMHEVVYGVHRWLKEKKGHTGLLLQQGCPRAEQTEAW